VRQRANGVTLVRVSESVPKALALTCITSDGVLENKLIEHTAASSNDCYGSPQFRFQILLSCLTLCLPVARRRLREARRDDHVISRRAESRAGAWRQRGGVCRRVRAGRRREQRDRQRLRRHCQISEANNDNSSETNKKAMKNETSVCAQLLQRVE
jgi:hypothetical protein